MLENYAQVLAQQPLKVEYQRYRDLFEFMPDGYLMTDVKGVVQEANRAMITLLNRDKSFLKDKPLLHFVAKKDRETFCTTLARLQTGGISRLEDWELHIQPHARPPFLATLTVAAIQGAEDQITGLYWLLRDISQHKALQEVWRQYEFIANTSKEFMTLINKAYIYQAINRSYCQAHNKTPAEIITKTVSDVWGEEVFKTIIKAQLDKCFSGQEVHDQSWFEFPSLGRRCFDVAYYPYHNTQGAVTHAVVVSRDITERVQAEVALRKAHDNLEIRVVERTRALSEANAGLKKQIVERERVEKALQESQKRLNRLLESVTDYTYSVKVEQGCPVTTSHSPACVRVTGYTPEEYEADPYLWHRMIYDEDRDTVMEQITKVFSGESPLAHEHRIIHKDGSIRWVRNTPVPYYDEQGRLISYAGTVIDITERKHAETEREQLLIAEQEQRLLAETLSEVFLAFTAQTNLETLLTEILRQIQRLIPYSAANIALLEGDLLHVAYWQGYETFVNQDLFINFEQSLVDFPLNAGAIQSRRLLLIPDTRRDPRWVIMPQLAWIKSFVAIPICLHDRVLGLLRLDGDTPNQFSEKDAKYLQPLANAAAIALENARLYEKIQQELEERRRVEQNLRQSEARNTALLEAMPDLIFQCSRDGTLLNYQVPENFALFMPSGKFLGKIVSEILPTEMAEQMMQAIAQTLQSGDVQRFECQLPVNSNLPEHTYEVRIVASGADEVLVIMRDITRHKQAEQQLIRAERLAALGQLAAALAHEMNNPLQAIQSHLDLLLDFPLDSDERESYLHIIRHEIRRLSEVTRPILNYSRLQATHHQFISLIELIEEVLVLTNKRLQQNGVQVIAELDDVPLVLAAPDQLIQVFLNLIINAIEALSEGGLLHIAFYNEADQIAVSFTDNGPPIPSDVLPHIFEPFYTTKPGGSGLGLWVSHSLIKQHGGSLSVENLSRHRGVVFTVRVPIPSSPELQDDNRFF